jgi:hypothetical protein
LRFPIISRALPAAALALLGASALPLHAQTRTAAADEAAVRAAVQRIFDGMHEADSAKVRSVFAPDARFAMVTEADGVASVRYQPVDGWIRAIANSGGTWEERTYDVEVRIDNGMAMVWAPYTFLRNGEISHCGINSIAMLRVDGRWLVTQLSDTRRQGACPAG